MDGVSRRYYPEDHQMRKWLRSLPSFGWRDKHRWYLIVPDWEHPSKSVIIVHDDLDGVSSRFYKYIA